MYHPRSSSLRRVVARIPVVVYPWPAARVVCVYPDCSLSQSYGFLIYSAAKEAARRGLSILDFRKLLVPYGQLIQTWYLARTSGSFRKKRGLCWTICQTCPVLAPPTASGAFGHPIRACRIPLLPLLFVAHLRSVTF